MKRNGAFKWVIIRNGGGIFKIVEFITSFCKLYPQIRFFSKNWRRFWYIAVRGFTATPYTFFLNLTHSIFHWEIYYMHFANLELNYVRYSHTKTVSTILQNFSQAQGWKIEIWRKATEYMPDPDLPSQNHPIRNQTIFKFEKKRHEKIGHP